MNSTKQWLKVQEHKWNERNKRLTAIENLTGVAQNIQPFPIRFYDSADLDDPEMADYLVEMRGYGMINLNSASEERLETMIWGWGDKDESVNS